MEINPSRKELGARALKAHDIDNVTLELGDAAQGWSQHGPYDVIVLTGSTPVLAEGFLDQLKSGGRLFAIVGDAPVMSARLITCTIPGSYVSTDLFETSQKLKLQYDNAKSQYEFSIEEYATAKTASQFDPLGNES